MGLKPREQSGSSAFPIVRKIHLRDMIEHAAYRRIRGKFFRIHYQFVSANTLEYYYDFFLICFGPLPMSAISNDPGVNVFPDGKAAR